MHWLLTRNEFDPFGPRLKLSLAAARRPLPGRLKVPPARFGGAAIPSFPLAGVHAVVRLGARYPSRTGSVAAPAAAPSSSAARPRRSRAPHQLR